jgi:hypothetical protein
VDRQRFTRFSFAAEPSVGSPPVVKRSHLRAFLIVSLLVSAVFAGWVWLRPYEWRADPAARSTIAAAMVKEDHGYYWLHLHLKVTSGESHDLMKPVRLVTAGGRELEPADTTLGGTGESGTTAIWFKFWLEPADIGGALNLRINDGTLTVKSSQSIPSLGPEKEECFATHRW